jgi:F-type H+-transporting ATPase subunit gamma
MQTLESLKRQIVGAGELKSIVRTMKAMAAANIGQYEASVASLEDYYTSVALGIVAYFQEKQIGYLLETEKSKNDTQKSACAIVFGSDQGFVGQFNDSLTAFVTQSFLDKQGTLEVWTVGARIPLLLKDAGLNVTKNFPLPNSINRVTSLIGSILIDVEESHAKDSLKEFFIFHNQSKQDAVYGPNIKRLLPFDEQWRQEWSTYKWPTKKIPEVIGRDKDIMKSLISEYLFVTLFKACAESLASENYSRLGAMQRAEKNIEELLDDVNHAYHRLRQSSIDEELFDVVSGFEALKDGLKPDSRS